MKGEKAMKNMTGMIAIMFLIIVILGVWMDCGIREQNQILEQAVEQVKITDEKLKESYESGLKEGLSKCYCREEKNAEKK
jgi:hypothetical protein